MPEHFHAEELVGFSNRRSAARQQVRSLSYIDLGDGNGGIVLNLSEGGLALQAVTSLMDDSLPRMRFQLSESRNWLEASGRITWASESRKVAGVEFVNLSDTARGQIKEWITAGDAPKDGKAADHTAHSEKTSSTSTTGDSLLYMRAPGRSGAGAVPKDNLQATLNAEQPSATLADGASAALDSSVQAEPAKSSWTLNPTRPEPRYRLVVLFGVLAVVSLFLGWAAGHAGLSRILNRTNVTSASPRPAITAAPFVSGGNAKISQIEIEAAGDQHRLIPFEGPLAPDPSVGHGTGHRAVPGNNMFRVWVLSPPVRSKDASLAGTALSENAPPLTTVPASSTNILPSAGFELRSAPPPRSQKPSAPVEDLQRGHLIRRVEPLYPSGALLEGVEGTVKLHAVIGDDGSVKTLESVSGPDVLIDPAMNAVRQWRYTPTLLDGKPIETDQDIFIVFRLPLK